MSTICFLGVSVAMVVIPGTCQSLGKVNVADGQVYGGVTWSEPAQLGRAERPYQDGHLCSIWQHDG